MTPAETTTILRQFNEWRRSDYEPSEQPAPPDPIEIGEAIDAAVEMIERLEAAEKERDELRAKVAGLVPIGLLHVGGYYGEELEDWEFEADQQACDKLNEVYVSNPTSLPLYALPGAQTQGE